MLRISELEHETNQNGLLWQRPLLHSPTKIPVSQKSVCFATIASRAPKFDYTVSDTQSAIGKQGWRSGESARLPPMCPGYPDPASYVGWVCCWFSPLLRGFFSGISGFPPSSKTNISKFQFDLEFEGHGFISWRLLCVTFIKQSWFIWFYLREFWTQT